MSQQIEIREQLEKREPEINISSEEPLWSLFDVVKDSINNIRLLEPRLKNFEEEERNFLDEENYIPDFEFTGLDFKKEKLLEILNQCRDQLQKIDEESMEKYGAQELNPEDMREFFRQIFREIELHIKLIDELDEEENWRKYSEEIWPEITEEKYTEALREIRELELEDEEKNIKPEELAEMFRDEFTRLGVEYEVELREVQGSFNLPGEKKLITSKGRNGERMYSKEEAEALTIHETFHAIRGLNGYRACEKSGFPPILGVFTPFYDQTEEGGAVYREKVTGKLSGYKKFDYLLRLIASYKISKSTNFREEFTEIAEELVELGADKERAFKILARNRQGLRHHIYWNGVEQWEKGDREKLLIGKLNPEWAEKFSREIGGMIGKPEIGPEKLFRKDLSKDLV